MNPYGGTNSLDTISAFIKALSYLLAGEGVWGRGRRRSTEMLSTFDPIRPLGPSLVLSVRTGSDSGRSTRTEG